MRRTLLFVVGVDEPHYKEHIDLLPKNVLVDLRRSIYVVPRDPAIRFDWYWNLIDDVASQPAFSECVSHVVSIAVAHGIAVVACRRGKHRSPVVAAAAAMVLRERHGYAAMVCELALVQHFMLPKIIGLVTDWQFIIDSAVFLSSVLVLSASICVNWRTRTPPWSSFSFSSRRRAPRRASSVRVYISTWRQTNRKATLRPHLHQGVFYQCPEAW
jgi:hypothetical protein